MQQQLVPLAETVLQKMSLYFAQFIRRGEIHLSSTEYIGKERWQQALLVDGFIHSDNIPVHSLHFFGF